MRSIGAAAFAAVFFLNSVSVGLAQEGFAQDACIKCAQNYSYICSQNYAECIAACGSIGTADRNACRRKCIERNEGVRDQSRLEMRDMQSRALRYSAATAYSVTGGQEQKIAVAVDVVDAIDGRPVFVGVARWAGSSPGRGCTCGSRHRRRDRGRCAGRSGAGGSSSAVSSDRLDVGDLGAHGDHGFAEAVEFGFGFGLGGLDHQGAGYGEGHGGGVEAVVDEALGDVFDGDAGGLLEGAGVEDALVGARPLWFS